MTQLPKIDQFIIWVLRSIPRVNRIIQISFTEAYDKGYAAGVLQGSKLSGKKYQNKVKKVLKNRYTSSRK